MVENKILDKPFSFLLGVLCLFNLIAWLSISSFSTGKPEIDFLDVGQGDSTLVKFDNKVKILTDAGPNKEVLDSLSGVLKSNYLDLAVITHPQVDHFYGFKDVFNSYKIGAIIWSGREGDGEDWQEIRNTALRKQIPWITVSAGDLIRYKDNEVKILAPTNEFINSAELNDASVVQLVKTNTFKALMTGDIGQNVESFIASQENIHADILKMSHHGSKFSSAPVFLRASSPKLAIIEVGQNSYGHPSAEAIERLKEYTKSLLFRTDQNGTIRVFKENNSFLVFGNK